MKQSLCSLCILLLLSALPHPGQAVGAEAPPATAAKPKAVPLSGKVLETMDGGGYTYLLLSSGSEKNWVAIPLSKIAVGQELTLIPGFEMKNFTSKGLNRKFDKVIFSAGIVTGAAKEKIVLSPSAIKMLHEGGPNAAQGKTAAAKADASTPAKPAAPAAASAKPAAPTAKHGKVAKAKGHNAYTIAELYAKKMKLEKQTVIVRGRVVKIATHIMKKNWFHIQDGSGSAKKLNNDLAVTSTQLPNEGDVVTIKGTCYNNMDFGAGYKYTLIVLDASIAP